MDTAAYQQFFLEPDDSRHRRYEALRALFVEQHSRKRVAQDYGVSYGTLSNWASEFRASRDPIIPSRRWYPLSRRCSAC